MTEEILRENTRRQGLMRGMFDPITGEGSIGERVKLTVPGHSVPVQWVPPAMLADPEVKAILRTPMLTPEMSTRLDRVRCRYDFPFWAAKYVYIKCKGGGDDCLFRLTYPQRLFVARLEELRLAGRPIRLVLLKARQWGGSTTSQLYMAWLQLLHCTGLNSLIIAHQCLASDEIKDMFDRMIRQYPVGLLYAPGEKFKETEKKLVTVGRTGGIFRVPQRNCKIKIGTAERPNSCRGGDYNLVHLSEVGLWRATDDKKPEDIVRSACAGVVYKPMTMIVYESTANGVGNFFHKEYVDARDNPRSQFRAMFVSWYEIENNQLPLTFDALYTMDIPYDKSSDTPLSAFARWLCQRRECEVEPSNREESGAYLWWLWQKGATLEGIHWYIMERAKHSSHGSMAAECPTDDREAFVNSGASVFDMYRVEALRPSCRKPLYVGEVVGMADAPMMSVPSPDIITDLHFVPDKQGCLWVWALPDCALCDKRADVPMIAHRYLTVVDVGGRSDKADWSVIVVIDRLLMIDGGRPAVVAQWRGHCDIDILAWKAAQIAAYYDESLLVIESNTLETRDAERMVEGDQSQFILNQIRNVYPNLYARRQSEEDVKRGLPRKYGFHTNVSTKPMIISTLVKMVREGLYTERDERCLNEYLVYERRRNGSYGAISGEHDDLLMTRAIGLHICFYEMPLPCEISSSPVAIMPKKLSAASIL